MVVTPSKIKQGQNFKAQPNAELLADHALAHSGLSLVKKGKSFGDWSLKDLVSFHDSLIKEMDSRGLKHDTPALAKGNSGFFSSMKDWLKTITTQTLVSGGLLNPSQGAIKPRITTNPFKFPPGLDPKDAKEMPTQKLLAVHDTVHEMMRLSTKGLAKGFTTKDLIEKHQIVVEAMQDRGLIHRSRDLLDDFVKQDRMPTGSSGEVLGEEIHLADIVTRFKSFKIRTPFISLVGGLVANGKTSNDIDLLIKETRDMPPGFKHVLEWRILRAFPDLADRIQFIYEDDNGYSMHGPISDHIPLFDLSIERINDENRIIEMSDSPQADDLIKRSVQTEATELSKRDDRIEMFRFFLPPKPVRTDLPDTPVTLESFVKGFSDKKFPIFVQKKHRGVRHIVFKSGNRVRIMSADGVDHTSRLPHTIAELKKLSEKSFVLDVSIEAWVVGKSLPRECVVEYLTEKSRADDSALTMNVFDVVFFDETDLHRVTYVDRMKILGTLSFQQATTSVPNSKLQLNISQMVKAENANQLRSLIEDLLKLPASCGVVTKFPQSLYPLDGVQSGWSIFQKEDTEVLVGGTLTPTARVDAIVKPGSGDSRVPGSDSVEAEHVAKIASTSRPKTPGLILSDTMAKLVANESKSMVVKARKLSLPGEWIILGDHAYGIARFSGPIKLSSDDFSRTMALHKISDEERETLFPGAEVFYAHRIVEFIPFDEPVPFVKPRRSGEIVRDVKFTRRNTPEFRKTVKISALVNIQKQEVEKLGNGRANLREALKDNEGERCDFCRFFEEPVGCLAIEGPVEKDLVCDWIQSRGTDAPQYKVAEEDWIAFGIGMVDLQPYEHRVIDVANTPAGQLVLIQDTSDPIHRFSLSREFHIEHTSLEHHWTQEEVDRMIAAGKEALKKSLFDVSDKHTNISNAPKETGFVLQFHWFKDDSKTHWDLRVGSGKESIQLELNQDPLKYRSLSAISKQDNWEGGFDFEGSAPPGHPLNKTENTPSRVFILDKGEVSILADGPELKSFRFSGSQLKGEWIGKKADGLWTFAKSEQTQVTNPKEIRDERVHEAQHG